MIHHVTLEVRPEDAERFGELLGIIGFEPVEAPEVFEGAVPWFARGPHQIHLILTPEATIPQIGHPAVVANDYERDLERLRKSGFEVNEARELWGEPRAFVLTPGGGRIEIMRAPPS